MHPQITQTCQLHTPLIMHLSHSPSTYIAVKTQTYLQNTHFKLIDDTIRDTHTSLNQTNTQRSKDIMESEFNFNLQGTEAGVATCP